MVRQNVGMAVSVHPQHALSALAKRFAWCAQFMYRDSSPLYEQLAARVADDVALLEIAAAAPVGQPVANLFFAAARFIALDSNVEDPVGIGSMGASVDDPYTAFRAFCLEHEVEMRELVRARGVQTNEVRRCACLVPALHLAEQMARAQRSERPLAIVEIGTSAGLNLLLDRYHYTYSDGRSLGNPDSPVRISCELRGGGTPPIPSTLPGIGHRIGIDLSPVDIFDDGDVRWLAALIWPEHVERQELLEQALSLARSDPPTRIAGDAVELLPGMLEDVPGDMTLVVVHSYTLNQFRAEMRECLNRLLTEHAERRDVYRVAIEWLAGEHPLVQTTSYRSRVTTERIVARCDQHGSWLEWFS